MGIENTLEDLSNAIQKGDHFASQILTNQLVEADVTAQRILDSGLMPGMNIVGDRFKRGLIFLPQVLVSARAMKMSMSILEPLLAKSEYKAKGKILVGTVKGDVHDIGKNLVSIMLRGAGYEVVDIGVGCPAERFVQACQLHQPDVVGLSALLTTTMVYMKTVIEALADAGIQAPVIVGGAPVSSRFAEEIGAAGYAHNASDAVALVQNLLHRKDDES